MGKRGWKILEIVFYIVAGVLFLGQVINLIKTGPNTETLVVFSEVIVFIVFGLVFIFRKNLSSFIKKLNPLSVKFVLIGYLSTVLAETAYIFSKPLHRNLLIDLLLVTPWYVLWMISWYHVLKRYDFTVKQAFFLGGFHGFVVEALISGGLILSPHIAIIFLPLFTVIYSCFFIVPYLLTKDEFVQQERVSLKKKILVSLIPLLAYIPGFIWILLITKLFGLTLH